MSILHLLNAVGGGSLQRNRPERVNGHWSVNFVVVSSFPVRRPFAPSGAEMMLAERMETKVTHITYSEPSRDVRRGDRITIEAVEYGVTAVLPPSKPHHLKIMLERREHGELQP